ncbi:MAG: hypothetical protein RL701_6902 [Pseudomonadota bacterium]|jgi:uncharacterized membrane protein
MLNLIAAALSFAGLHLCVSGTSLRGVLIRRIGEGAYRALFSFGSFATLIWLTRSYSRAYLTENAFYWALPHAQHVAAPIMGSALLLAIPGLASRSPTAVGQEGLLRRDVQPRGMQRITRHPFLWGVLIWSTFHLAANGDRASIALFSTFWIVAAVGTVSIDAKRAQVLGELWTGYRSQTSNLPFAAILSKRTHFSFKEIGVWRVLLAVLAFCVIVSVHPWLFHAYPLPGMDD